MATLTFSGTGLPPARTTYDPDNTVPVTETVVDAAWAAEPRPARAGHLSSRTAVDVGA